MKICPYCFENQSPGGQNNPVACVKMPARVTFHFIYQQPSKHNYISLCELDWVGSSDSFLRFPRFSFVITTEQMLWSCVSFHLSAYEQHFYHYYYHCYCYFQFVNLLSDQIKTTPSSEVANGSNEFLQCSLPGGIRQIDYISVTGGRGGGGTKKK